MQIKACYHLDASWALQDSTSMLDPCLYMAAKKVFFEFAMWNTGIGYTILREGCRHPKTPPAFPGGSRAAALPPDPTDPQITSGSAPQTSCQIGKTIEACKLDWDQVEVHMDGMSANSNAFHVSSSLLHFRPGRIHLLLTSCTLRTL